MISIPQPALALNAHNVPPPIIRMWNTGIVQSTKTPLEIMNWICQIAASAPNGKLRALILNCHGYSVNGELGYGLSIGTGIDYRSVELFNLIKEKVGVIYITACGAGRIATSHTPGAAGDGHYFLSSIARNSRAMVIASTELQASPPSIPVNHIDNFEGLMVVYNRHGQLTNSTRYRSLWREADGYHGQND